MSPPPKNAEEVQARNLYHAYLAGWKNAAANQMIDSRFSEHDDGKITDAYAAGYADGKAARVSAFKKAEMVYGYKPSILRAQEPLKFVKSRK
jgi:hypothetical protein